MSFCIISCVIVCFIFVHAAFVRIKLMMTMMMMMMMMMMIMQGTMSGARMRGRPPTAWMDYIKTWKKTHRGRVSQNDRGQR